MSNSVRPHRRQPTRLPRPWDSPGKNTGVGCHFLVQGMKVKSESEVAQLCPTLSDLMDCSLPSSSVHGIFQAKVLEWGAYSVTECKKRVYIYIYIYTLCMCVCIYICMYMYTCIHTYICIYTIIHIFIHILCCTSEIHTVNKR